MYIIFILIIFNNEKLNHIINDYILYYNNFKIFIRYINYDFNSI